MALLAIPGALREGGGTSVGWSCALAFLLALWEGGRFGVIGFVTARSVRNGWPVLAAFPVALVATEWLYPMFFPWSSSLFLQAAPALLQCADLGGPLFVSFCIGLLDASLVSAWTDRPFRPLRLGHVLVRPAAALGAFAIYGIVRMREVDARVSASPVLTVGIVQGDFATPTRELRDPVPFYRAASLELLRNGAVDLLVWPETAIPYVTDLDALPARLQRVVLGDPPRIASQSLGVPLLTGMVLERAPPVLPANVRELNPDGSWQTVSKKRFNSAVLVAPDGEVLGVYDKRDLVAFGEYVPGEKRFPWLRRLLPSAGAFSAGGSSSPLSLHGRGVAALICYEDILAERVRGAVGLGGAELIVDITSDTWFGRSRVPSLHLALARLRAIEHRRFLVHATNTGVTAIVDPAGRIVTELPPNRPASAIATVRWMSGGTLYERVASTPAWAAAAVAAIMVIWRRGEIKRERRLAFWLASPRP